MKLIMEFGKARDVESFPFFLEDHFQEEQVSIFRMYAFFSTTTRKFCLKGKNFHEYLEMEAFHRFKEKIFG